jgi:hypothetical protein
LEERVNIRLRFAAIAVAAAVPLALAPAGLAHAYDDHTGGGYEEVTGGEGCTPGYWKNHTDSWTVYSPSQSLSSVFAATPAVYSSTTLLQGLSFNGGNGADGASRILLRAAVAAGRRRDPERGERGRRLPVHERPDHQPGQRRAGQWRPRHHPRAGHRSGPRQQRRLHPQLNRRRR